MLSRRKRIMSLASREALNNLISNADVAQFATHAEDWSTCSSAGVLVMYLDKPAFYAI